MPVLQSSLDRGEPCSSGRDIECCKEPDRFRIGPNAPRISPVSGDRAARIVQIQVRRRLIANDGRVRKVAVEAEGEDRVRWVEIEPGDLHDLRRWKVDQSLSPPSGRPQAGPLQHVEGVALRYARCLCNGSNGRPSAGRRRSDIGIFEPRDGDAFVMEGRAPPAPAVIESLDAALVPSLSPEPDRADADFESLRDVRDRLLAIQPNDDLSPLLQSCRRGSRLGQLPQLVFFDTGACADRFLHRAPFGRPRSGARCRVRDRRLYVRDIPDSVSHSDLLPDIDCRKMAKNSHPCECQDHISRSGTYLISLTLVVVQPGEDDSGNTAFRMVVLCAAGTPSCDLRTGNIPP